MLAGNVISVLNTWLIKNQLPRVVIEMANDAVILERIARAMDPRPYFKKDAIWLNQELPQITLGIMQLGGHFDDIDTTGPSREPLKWDYLEKLQAIVRAARDLQLRHEGTYQVDPDG
jgi:hypothetical protein